MKRLRRKNRVFLAALVSSWVLLFFAYVHSYNLAEAHFLCMNPHLENPFLEGFLSALKGKWDFNDGDRPSFVALQGDTPFFPFAPTSLSNLASLIRASSLRC